MSVYFDLENEEAFYTYHTLCTYLTGEYRQFRTETGATKEDVRRVASKIETGADGVWLSKTEAHALADAYCAAYRDTPLDFPFSEARELAEAIYDVVPDDGGALRYGPDWPQTRQRVLERDGHECRECGMSNDTHEKRRGHGLHVHHIQPLREFEEVEEANRLENLVALCASCHQRLEGESFEEVGLA